MLKTTKTSVILTTVFLSIIIAFTSISLIAQNSQATDSPKTNKEKTDNSTKSKVAYSLDFSNKGNINPRIYLKNRGFKFKKDATDESYLGLKFSKDSLVFNSKTDLFGIIITEDIKVENPKKIRITWGVDKYPKGASYEKNVNNEALMVYVYFGNKKLTSGSFFLPESPYFIGLFLGKEDKLNKPYKGSYYHKGGRFVCVGNPKEGKTVTSEFKLNKGFKKYFGADKEVPFVSGLALEVDTSDTSSAKAHIKQIEFLN